MNSKHHKYEDYCKRFLLAMENGDYIIAQSLAHDLIRIDEEIEDFNRKTFNIISYDEMF